MNNLNLKNIQDIQIKLNSAEFTPQFAYRRNSIIYPLVCYVNNITSLFISKNYAPISTFIERAKQHIENNPSKAEWEPYYQLVENYLELMMQFISNEGNK
mgnify:CR=1 FL=1